MFDLIFFFKQKTAYEMRISDWSSDVCSSDLQICMAIKRLYVHADIHDEVVRRFARLADEIRLGDGMLPDSEMGPVQNRAQYEKLLDLLADTRSIPGAHNVAGGVEPESEDRRVGKECCRTC